MLGSRVEVNLTNYLGPETQMEERKPHLPLASFAKSLIRTLAKQD